MDCKTVVDWMKNNTTVPWTMELIWREVQLLHGQMYFTLEHTLQEGNGAAHHCANLGADGQSQTF
ncbi:hypothetical protein GIB67_016763, partial [Kingdonia uniflora]